MEDPHMQALFKKRWNWFKTNKYSALKKHIKNWAKTVKPAYKDDHDIWGLRGSSGDADTDLQQVLDWLDARVNYIDNYVSGLR
jgi:CHAD domain-containing protein